MSQRTDALGNSRKKRPHVRATFASTLTSMNGRHSPETTDGSEQNRASCCDCLSLEILAQRVAHGKPADITAEAVNEMNAGQA